MQKTYADFMNEIESEELYDCLVQYGLFSEKLPPVFDCSEFLAHCKSDDRVVIHNESYGYAVFNSMRNTNIVRPIGVPTPLAHERLCMRLKDSWPNLQEYFVEKTQEQEYIKSRIHIRKMKDTDSLFKMNYDNWRLDGTPEPDISLGKRYLVKADISKCFPGIYTHAIPWALATKAVAKKDFSNELWYNAIDRDTRNSTAKETHGLLIGPHTSNILSEIILCAVDEKLSKWDYVRNIDDYSCYVETREKADSFLIELDESLREFGLSLNHKKTEIVELPVGAAEQWTHQLKNETVYLEKFQPYVDYKEVQAVIDFCIKLMAENKNNASILLYGMKILNEHNLTDNAKIYVSKTMTSLSLIYPYIVPLLDEFVYEPYEIKTKIAITSWTPFKLHRSYRFYRVLPQRLHPVSCS